MGGCLSLKKKKVEVVQENEKKESSKEVQVGNSASDKSTSLVVPLDDRPTPDFGEKFTYQELADATNNFSPATFLGQGGFGPVHRGLLERTQQVVAIKKLDKDSAQGNEEYFTEVRMLSHLDHPNLVKLIGSCAERDQKLIVYEFMPLGSLDAHLHGIPSGKKPLDWNTRMKIAEGVAKVFEYLHKEKPPVIHRDLKSANILLGPGYHPKLSDFGFARLGPEGDKTHVSTRVMGTRGYCAPEYLLTGRLSPSSDIYCLGVVLLELITGRNPAVDWNLVEWARPRFKEHDNFHTLVDPLLLGNYPKNGLFQALAVTEMCLREKPDVRPEIGMVVTALSFLASQTLDPNAALTRHREVDQTIRGRRNVNVGEIESQESQRNNPASRRKGRGGTPKNLGNDLNRDNEVAKAREWAMMHKKDTNNLVFTSL